MSAKCDETSNVSSEDKRPKDDKSFIQLDDKKGAASAAPASRSHLVAGVLAAACVALIVISLGFVHTTSGVAWSLSWITESLGFTSSSIASVRGGESSAQAGPSSSDSKESGKSADAEKIHDAKDAKESKKSKDGKESKVEKKSSEEKKDDPQESKNAGGDSSVQSGAGNGVVSGGNASNGGASNGGDSGAGSTSNGGASSNANGGSKDDGFITVSVSVTSSTVGNPVSAGGSYTFQQGATAYDALCALGLSVNSHGSQYGTYVAAIGGLAEKEHGGQSGWMYSVNGSTPMTACSNYVLSNGDNVVWYYVTG